MKKTVKDELIIFGVTFVVLFISQRLFNCFVYRTDGISMLFGVILVGVAFCLRLFLDDWIVSYKLKKELKKLEKELKKLEKELEELQKKYEV